ncbi:MAG: FprA family A-type flavoprotein [Rikenellaceae bacterium]|jgi:flavorubredoxin|nr:FprA family A-type flavoprotein [Rikenellaceae bacterium]
MDAKKISEHVYAIHADICSTALFEGIWPIPSGVTLNSYVVKSEKTALIDFMRDWEDAPSKLEAQCRSIGVSLHKIDYLILNHLEPDHAGHIRMFKEMNPGVEIIATKKGINLVRNFFKIQDNLREVKTGDTLDLGGGIVLSFMETPNIHWPETMMSYEISEQILFSGDAFGTFGTINGGVLDSQTRLEFYKDEMRRYYSNIVGKYSSMVQKAFAKVAGVPIQMICSLHGPVWKDHVAEVISMYDRWSRYEAEPGVMIAYASMYGNTARMADHIAMLMAQKGVRDIVVHDVSKTHISYLINDIWKYRGVILGSCAYNSEMFPPMEALCRDMVHMQVKNKTLGLFGGYSWNGGGVRNLCKWAEEIGWEQVAPAVEMHGRPTAEKYAACEELASAMAAKLLGGEGYKPAEPCTPVE